MEVKQKDYRIYFDCPSKEECARGVYGVKLDDGTTIKVLAMGIVI